MRVLIGCECSGTVRDEFTKFGHDAWSCDLKPTLVPGKHYQCSVTDIWSNGWDLLIIHPPCTVLAVSGARWFDDPKYPTRRLEQVLALNFFRACLNAPIKRIAVENPVCIAATQIRPPDQIIDPFDFGHGVTKKTCLWLKNLPKLQPLNLITESPVLESPVDRAHRSFAHMLPPSEDRQHLRAVTFRNIAYAMAKQWGSL